MPTDLTVAGFSRAQVEQAQRQLRSLLVRVAHEAQASGKDVAVQVLCAGIESAIPIPVLNKAVAGTVRRLLNQSSPGPKASLDDVVHTLDEMQASDTGFESGIRELGADIEQIAADVESVQAMLVQNQRSDLVLAQPKVEEHWPMLDNQVSFIVANRGGGTVFVDEIYLDVERWEPELEVIFSTPAAPLAVVHLRAELDTRIHEYALLELNGEPQRVYNERGAGAERVQIDLHCEQNAHFWLRVRIPFATLDGERGEAVYPPADQSPFELRFPVGPGWRNVDVERLLERQSLYTTTKRTLAALADLFATTPPDDSDNPERERVLQELRVPDWSVNSFGLTGFLNRFIPFLAALAPAEDRASALAVVRKLLANSPPPAVERLADSESFQKALQLLSATN